MPQDKLIDLILNDRIDEAAHALDQTPGAHPALAVLIPQAQAQAPPLAPLASENPNYIIVNPSYTCNIGCAMCVTGFHDKTEIYGNYKYMLPEEFEALRPWFQAGTHVVFVGLGETLDSPHLTDFVRSITDRVTVVTTSGVPLTREKTRDLMEAGLDLLYFSFDGKTTVGHGNGSEAYVRNIWKKIDMVRQIKEEMGYDRPELGLHIAINRENLDDLDAMLRLANERGIRDVQLFTMLVTQETGVVRPELFERSFGVDFDDCRERTNALIERWTPMGMRIQVYSYPRLENSHTPCLYIDNFISLNGAMDRPTICCGTLQLPIAQDGHTPEEYWNTFPVRYLRYLHQVGTPEQLPEECRDCAIMNPDSYFQGCRRKLNPSASPWDPYPVYQAASRLKREGKYDEAALRFHHLFEEFVPAELQGKAAYHLAEMQVDRGDYQEALSWAQRSIQLNFRHRMAWALVYLLMRATQTPEITRRRDKYAITYHPEITVTPQCTEPR